jgi:hypothetical protein
MRAAVLISQKPPRACHPEGRRCAMMLLTWVWPLTHATTLGCCNSGMLQQQLLKLGAEDPSAGFRFVVPCGPV